VRPLTDGRLVVFGPEHLVLLGIFAAGCIAVAVAGRRLRGRPILEARARRTAAVLILVSCGPFEALDWVHAVHYWRSSLPIQICDFGWFVAAVALLTGSRAWSGLLYFWGLTLCVQGVITPDLDHLFPQAQFFGYWIRHLAPPWAALYLVAAGVGPRWREYRLVVAVTLAVAAPAMVLNRIFGSNYEYLNAKPVSHSVLDLLGPWPWYVVVEIALLLGSWALMTWPWNRAANACALGRRGTGGHENRHRPADHRRDLHLRPAHGRVVGEHPRAGRDPDARRAGVHRPGTGPPPYGRGS